MKEKGILVRMLIDKAEQYGKTNIELYKLKAIDKGTDVFASVASRVVIFAILALFLLVLTLGLAFYLGEVLGKNYYGFFAVAAIYAIIAILIMVFRKPLEDIFNDYIINQIFKEKKNAGN